MRNLMKYLKPFTIPICIVLILVFFQSLSELYLPDLMSDILNEGVSKGDTAYILRIGGVMLMISGLIAISTVLVSYLSARIGMGFGRDVRNIVFEKVESYSLNEFDKIGTSSLITRTTNDITQVQNVIIMILRMVVSAPLMGIGGIIMAASKDAKLTIIFAVVLPILMGVIGLVGKLGFPLFKAIQGKVDKLNLILREYLTGIRVIRAFNREEYEKEHFDIANVDLTDNAIRVNKLMGTMMPLMMVIFNITSVAIIWFGSFRIDEMSLDIGNLFAFLQYAMQIMFSLVMVSMIFIMIPRAQASAVRINEILRMSPEIIDPHKPNHDFKERGSVTFSNVTFSYANAEEPAIQGISFSAKKGEVTAIIGGTGSGKSTIINLIPRFYDIQEGNILVDGIDIREMNQDVLRDRIGFVPQKALLFSGSIADNLRFGKEDATEAEIINALEIAQAIDFVQKKEDGIETIISQGGTNVSGGQKQRLSIARALVKKPEIYIFDDSFSALDTKTDAKLRKSLKAVTEDATVIIVAQRVSTVLDADRIIVMNDGEIAGMGTHQELLTSCDVYKEIVSSQLSEEEIS